MAKPAPDSNDIAAPGSLQPATSDVLLHIMRGCSNTFKTNGAALSMALLIAAIITVVPSAYLTRSTAVVLADLKGHDATATTNAIVVVIAQSALSLVIGSLCSQLIARIVLTGSRRQHVRLGTAALFTLRRLGILLIAYGSIAAGFMAALVACLVLLKVLGSLGALALLALMIYAVIGAVIYLSYLSYAIADDDRPGSALAALRASHLTWRASRQATILNLVTLAIVSLVVQSVLRQLHLLPAASTVSLTSTAVIGLGISIVINLVLGAAIGTGFADIYNEVHGKLPVVADKPQKP